MEPFDFTGLPTRVVLGPHKIATLPAEMENLGVNKALLCCSPGRSNVVKELYTRLNDLCAGVCARALPFTPWEVVLEGRQAAQDLNADCLISYGGGNAVGFAKAVALELALPIIAIPTTLSGSETTALQGIIRNGKRTQNASPNMQAKTIIYDAELTLDLPMSVMIPSGMNATAHAVGALVAHNNNPMSRMFAEKGIDVMANALRTLAKDAGDLNARTSAFYGAWLNANTLKLAPGGVNVHHKLCHTIGGGFGLSHAEVHTVILPHSTAYNRNAIPDAMATIASALGHEGGDAAQCLFDLELEIGAPTSLQAIGLAEDALEQVAEEVAMDSYYNNPRPIERDGIRALLDDAFHGRRPE